MPVYFDTENNIFRAATKSRPAAYFVARALIQCHSGGTPNNVYFSWCLIYGTPIANGLKCSLVQLLPTSLHLGFYMANSRALKK